MNLEKNIAKIKMQAAATECDLIIRYMLSPDDESITLTDSQKKHYDILKFTHGLRMRYSRKTDVVKMLCHMYNFKDRQAYTYIKECEYVFSSLEDVHKDYERNFILESSRKNIELAMASRNSDLITKALLAHYKFCGLSDVTIDMPNFSALEPNKYIISLPEKQKEMLAKLMTGGSLNFNDLFPHQEVTFDIEHKDVTNGESE